MKQLLNKIKESFELLEFEDDWDQDGGVKADLIIFNKAMIFIHLLASHVNNLSVPNINLCKDASIDLFFVNKEYRLLVNIKKESASCFGAGNNDINAIKSGDLKMDDIINWCKLYMTE